MPNVTVRQFAEMTHTSAPNIYQLVKKHGLYVKGMYIKAHRGKLMYITEEGQELLRDNMRQPEVMLYENKEKGVLTTLQEQLAEKDAQLARKDAQIAALQEQISKTTEALLAAQKTAQAATNSTTP